MKSDSVTFQLPKLPPSMNQIYIIAPRRKQKVFLRPEVDQWKQDMKFFMPAWEPSDTGFIKLSFELWGNWFYKNGKVKRADGPNVEKILIDAIAERYKFDDCLIFEWSGSKVQSEDERILVKLELLPYEITQKIPHNKERRSASKDVKAKADKSSKV